MVGWTSRLRAVSRHQPATGKKNLANRKKSDDNDLAYEILRSLRKILRKTSQHSRQISRQSGMSVPQLLCLKAIGEADDATVVTAAIVAQSVHLSAPTATRIIDRLEEARFVKRTPHPSDRRKICLSLTPLGRKRLENLPTPLQEDFVKKLKKLRRAERAELLQSLHRIVEMMGAEDIDAAPMLTPELDMRPTA